MKMKFRMSDAEILDYMDAAIDKDKAVDSLAVKCHTTRGLMREHLGELGVLLEEPEKKPLGEFKAVEPKKKQGGAHNKKMDEAKAREMYDAGASDSEIATMFGMTAVAVCRWRKRNGLPSKQRRGDHRKENTEMKNDMNLKTNEDVGKEADFAMEARRAERELQESPVEPGTAGSACVETPVRVADEPDGMTVEKLAELFNNLCKERGRIVRVQTGGKPIREVVVTLRYDKTSTDCPAGMLIDLET